MATKAFEAFRERLKAVPLYVWMAPFPDHTIYIRCPAHLVPGKEGKKMTPREVWNGGYKCQTCGYPKF